MKTNKRQERREIAEKKEAKFNHSPKKGMTPYKTRKDKHKGDLFSHLDKELKY